MLLLLPLQTILCGKVSAVYHVPQPNVLHLNLGRCSLFHLSNDKTGVESTLHRLSFIAFLAPTVINCSSGLSSRPLPHTYTQHQKTEQEKDSDFCVLLSVDRINIFFLSHGIISYLSFHQNTHKCR